jgi:ABC-type multidrug transport system permease subunit
VIASNAALVGTTAAVGVASDMSSGVVDRFRSLPLSPSAILGGTVLANISSAVVPAESMPRGLEGFASNQPLSEAIDATRALLLGQPVGDYAWVTAVGCVAIAVLSAMVAGILFRRRFS